MDLEDQDSDVEPNDYPAEIATDQVCFIIVKMRVLGAKSAEDGGDDASDAIDDGAAATLDDDEEDATREELEEFIDALGDDEQIDLIALAWIGRGDYEPADFADAREAAAESYERRSSVAYLLETPLLSDFLEEALGSYGESCEATELDHL